MLDARAAARIEPKVPRVRERADSLIRLAARLDLTPAVPQPLLRGLRVAADTTETKAPDPTAHVLDHLIGALHDLVPATGVRQLTAAELIDCLSLSAAPADALTIAL